MKDVYSSLIETGLPVLTSSDYNFHMLSFLFLILTGASAWTLCVSTYSANLRAGPGPKFAITWVAPLHTPLIEHKRSGGWVNVEDMAGQMHWVYRTSVTSKYTCVSAKADRVRIRKGPSASAELGDLRFVDRFTPFKRVDVQGEWYQVVSTWGSTYWVHERSVWRPIKVTKISF